MNIENNRNTDALAGISPVIDRCFYTRKSALPEVYHKRVTHCYELEYIPWGEGYVMTDGEKLDAVAGTVFFRRPGMEIHGFLPYSSYGILLEDIPVVDLPTVSQFPPSHAIHALFQDVYKYYLSNDPLDQLRMKADVLNIIYHLMSFGKYEQKMKNAASAQYHMDRLEYLMEYIDKNLSQHMTLSELASICNISPGFLCRLFKQANNESLFSYINECRIQRARRLLIETNRPIKDICASCGFENESYFYRTFKRSMHVSPAGYRKIHRQPYEDYTGNE